MVDAAAMALDASPKVSDREARFRKKIEHDLGLAFLGALENDKTLDIALNPDGLLWQECFGEPMKVIGKISAIRAERAMRTIAGALDTVITRESPVLEGELPIDGSRFAGWFPPIVAAPAFAVRKKASVIFTLKDYLTSNIMSQAQYDALVEAVAMHRNILVIGGTGSGKTTLTNGLINEITRQFPNERMVIIEDTGEIQCAAKNALLFNSTQTTSMTDLLKTTLRARPDRILIGEVRGPEALDLLDAWNTGHEGGVATLHANHAEGGLDRLQSLITRHPQAPKDICALIGQAVHLIVHIARTESGRRVQSVLKVNGYHSHHYQLESISS